MKIKKKLPNFKNMIEHAEQEFWDENSIIDYTDEVNEIDLNYIDQRPPKKTAINLRIDERLKNQINKSH